MAIEETSYDNYLFEDRPTVARTAMERRDDLANMLAEKKEPDSEVVTAIAKQILGQGLTSKWTGAGKGSAEANARDMAKILAGIGITDIKQFGPITREVDAYIGSDDSGNPIYEKQTERTFGNKETGQVVPLTYSGRQTGNFFGGTYDGKGNTGYGVSFAADGTPIFYTQGASSNTLANLMQDMGPVFQIGLALATGGLSIPQQIAARMAVNVLSGQDIGDAVKSAAISMAVANIPGTDLMKSGSAFIKDLGLDATVTNTLTNSFQNAVTSGATAALTGQDVSDAMLRGAATGGVNGAVNALLNSADMKELTKDLSATQKRLVANAVTGVISGKPLDQVLINSAIAAASAEAKLHKPISDKEYGELDDDEKAKYNEAGTSALRAYQQQISNLERLTTSGRTGGDMGGDGGDTNTSKSPDPAELVIAAQQKADADAAARLAEQERLAREAQQAAEAAARAREEANRLAAEAKNLQDAENARKAREEADRLAREAKENEIRITAKRKADEEAAARLAEQEELARKAQQAASASKNTPVTPVGTVNITAPKAVPECPPGFVYDQDLKMCTPKESTGTLPTAPPIPPVGTVNITAPKAVPECPPGFVYDQDLKMCMPAESIGTPLPDPPRVTITDKKDTCPVGTKLNPVTGECDPVVEDKGRMTIIGKRDPCPPGTVYDEVLDACVPVPTPPVTPPTPTPPATKPTATKPPATKPPAATAPSSALPSFTPSGSSVPAETNTPFYAGEMGDFNLFSTLEEILADKSGKKDSTNSNVKTKMATGGHLDDLLAEQFSVDDLLKLLR